MNHLFYRHEKNFFVRTFKMVAIRATRTEKTLRHRFVRAFSPPLKGEPAARSAFAERQDRGANLRFANKRPDDEAGLRGSEKIPARCAVWRPRRTLVRRAHVSTGQARCFAAARLLFVLQAS
ncbi:MAG: hypothetical protein C4334_14515 [Pyrinomonas sp.]